MSTFSPLIIECKFEIYITYQGLKVRYFHGEYNICSMSWRLGQHLYKSYKLTSTLAMYLIDIFFIKNPWKMKKVRKMQQQMEHFIDIKKVKCFLLAKFIFLPFNWKLYARNASASKDLLSQCIFKYWK